MYLAAARVVVESGCKVRMIEFLLLVAGTTMSGRRKEAMVNEEQLANANGTVGGGSDYDTKRWSQNQRSCWR